jgi:hypothetical protein
VGQYVDSGLLLIVAKLGEQFCTDAVRRTCEALWYRRHLGKLGESVVMERKVICDLHLISVDFGREEERQPGNTFRITFRHANGQPTGTIDVYQGEAAHFSVELEAIAAFLRAALIANKNSNWGTTKSVLCRPSLGSSCVMNAFVVSGLVLAEAACPLLARIRSANARRGFPLPKVRISDA